MESTLRHSRARRGRTSEDEEGILHPDLLARIERAAPFPDGPARRKLEARTRESLRLLRSRKERAPAGVWDRIGERRMRRGPR